MLEPQQDSHWKYSAFISYSIDKSKVGRQWQVWLEEALRTYPISSKIKSLSPHSHLVNGNRLKRACVDHHDFLPGKDLDGEIRKKLQQSHTLIVLCSPTAQSAEWVNKEIRYFNEIYPEHEIVPVTIEVNEPAKTTREIFSLPNALFNLTSINVKESAGDEPLALDFRLDVNGRKYNGYTDPNKNKSFLIQEFDFVPQQIKLFSERYQTQLLDSLHKIVGTILSIEPRILKEEYLSFKRDQKIKKRGILIASLTGILAAFLGFKQLYITSPYISQEPPVSSKPLPILEGIEDGGNAERVAIDHPPKTGRGTEVMATIKYISQRIADIEKAMQDEVLPDGSLAQELDKVKESEASIDVSLLNLEDINSLAILKARHGLLQGKLFYAEKDPEAAIEQLTRAYQILQQDELQHSSKAQLLASNIASELAKIHRILGNNENIAWYANAAITILEKLLNLHSHNDRYKEKILGAYDFRAGVALSEKSNWDAHAWFVKALNIAEELLLKDATQPKFQYYVARYVYYAGVTSPRWSDEQYDKFARANQVITQLQKQFPERVDYLILYLRYQIERMEKNINGSSANIRLRLIGIHNRVDTTLNGAEPAASLVRIYSAYIVSVLKNLTLAGDNESVRVIKKEFVDILKSYPRNQENETEIVRNLQYITKNFNE